MSRNIFAELKKVKGSQQAGAFSVSKKEATKRMLLEAIGHEEYTVVSAKATTGSFVRWSVADFISAPLATTAAIFVFVLGGWLTTVNAASNSLPGDALYGLKLVTEQAQLHLASLENRAVLHTEFAQRRLTEAVAMSNSENPEKTSYVSSTLAAYKNEMTLAEGDLRELSQTGSDQTVQVATTIDQRITQLNTVIDASVASPDAAPDRSVSVTEAKDATDAASQAVVDVLVDTHESQASGSTASVTDLSKLFREGLADLENRQTFDLGRIAKIRAAIATHPQLNPSVVPTEEALKQFERQINAATAEVPSAMDALAIGGSRTAFDKLAAMKLTLKEIESRIAEQEIAITQAIQVTP